MLRDVLDGIPGRLLSVWVVPALAIATAGLAVDQAAAQAATEHTRRLEDGEPGQPATLADAEWLVGSWRGAGLGGTVDEVWLPAEGSAMAGVFRLTRGGGVSMYEIMTLLERDGTLVLELKHFDADLTAWEEAGETVQFPLVRAVADTLYFSGLTYARLAPDELRIWLAMRHRDGRMREVPFELRRQPLASRAAD